jgi:hypothetical protein
LFRHGQPLRGTRVVEATFFQNGPFAGALLAIGSPSASGLRRLTGAAGSPRRAGLAAAVVTDRPFSDLIR